MAVRKWCKTEENRDINVHVARLLVDLDVFVENVEWQGIHYMELKVRRCWKDRRHVDSTCGRKVD